MSYQDALSTTETMPIIVGVKELLTDVKFNVSLLLNDITDSITLGHVAKLKGLTDAINITYERMIFDCDAPNNDTAEKIEELTQGLETLDTFHKSFIIQLVTWLRPTNDSPEASYILTLSLLAYEMNHITYLLQCVDSTINELNKATAKVFN